MFSKILSSLILLILIPVCLSNSTLLSECETLKECVGDNQVCYIDIDIGFGECGCAPNYRDVNKTGKCEKYTCNTIKDCQDYEYGRYCKGGQCVCNENFTRNYPDITPKCSMYHCKNDSQCFHMQNTVCNIYGRCVCAPGYHYSYNETLKCEKQECKDDSRCSEFGSYLACRNGGCVCREGYKPDERKGNRDNCVESSVTYGKSCNTSWGCDRNGESCIDRYCRCDFNSRYNPKIELCEYFQCKEDNECKTYDKNRVCLSNGCVCPEGYISNYNYNSERCVKLSVTYQMNCSSDKSCNESNQRCVDRVCRCDPNYSFDHNSQQCLTDRHLCTDACSQYYDPQRRCLSNKCLCNEQYSEDVANGHKCVEIITDSPTNYNRFYVVGGIAGLFIGIILIIFIVRKLKKR